MRMPICVRYVSAVRYSDSARKILRDGGKEGKKRKWLSSKTRHRYARLVMKKTAAVSKAVERKL